MSWAVNHPSFPPFHSCHGWYHCYLRFGRCNSGRWWTWRSRQIHLVQVSWLPEIAFLVRDENFSSFGVEKNSSHVTQRKKKSMITTHLHSHTELLVSVLHAYCVECEIEKNKNWTLRVKSELTFIRTITMRRQICIAENFTTKSLVIHFAFDVN